VSVHDSSRFALNIPKTQKSFWTHWMVLLEAQVDACFGPFGDSANLDAIYVHVCAECTIGSEIILDTPDRTHR
jgi:hypothetical protein